nr:MAG TPA: Receptor Binding Protein [Caudoviricetes sp.]
MTIKSGFFNSLNHDRVYDADDINSIFDGIITDGVFGNIGKRFAVTPGSGMSVNVGTGKARFHQIFVENDANLVLQIPQSDVLLNRIDAVVIRVDRTMSGRTGNIVVLKGMPSQNPIAPTLSNDNQIWDMPIAYINVKANVNKVNSSDIQYLVGRNTTPLITAPMQTVNVESYVGKMEGQFSDWFSNLKDNLSTNAAGNLQNQINTIKPKVDAVNSALTFNGQNTTAKGQLDITGRLNAKNGLAIGGNDTFIVRRFTAPRQTVNYNSSNLTVVNINVPSGYSMVAPISASTTGCLCSINSWNENSVTIYTCNMWNDGYALPAGEIRVDVLLVRKAV